MTTATATAPVGTKGRRVTVTFDDGSERTMGDSRCRFVAVVSDDCYLAGADHWASSSATAAGAAALVSVHVRDGIYSNLRVIEVADPSTD